jgi:hypothetical protein
MRIRVLNTHTPSGELKVELFTTIGLDAVLVLETPSNGTGSNRQIPVVSTTKVSGLEFYRSQTTTMDKPIWGYIPTCTFKNTYVKPAAFQAATISAKKVQLNVLRSFGKRDEV